MMQNQKHNKLLHRIISFNYLSLTTIVRSFAELFVQMILAYNFGASRYVDAFYSALVLPNLIINVLTTSLRNIFIPTFTEERYKKGESYAWRVTSSLCNLLIIVLFIISLVAIFSSQFWMRLIAPGLATSTNHLAASMTKIIFPIIVIGGVIIIIDVVFYTHEQFRPSAIATFGRFGVYVFVVLFFTPIIGIYATAIGIVSGYLINLLIQITFFKKYRESYFFGIDFKTSSLKKPIILWVQLLLLSSIFRLSPLIDRFFASQLGEGSVSHIAYASSFLGLAGLLSSNNIALILFPSLANLVACDDKKNLSKLCMKSISASAYITLPIFIVIATLSEKILRLLLQRGQFGADDSRTVSLILLFASGSILFPIITSTTANILYSLKSIKILYVQAFSLLFTQLLTITITLPFFGIYSLGLSSSITFLVSASIHLIYLIRNGYIYLFDFSKEMINIGKQSVCALGMAAVCITGNIFINYMQGNNIQLFFVLSASILLGLCVYFVLSFIFRVEEVTQIVKRLPKINIAKYFGYINDFFQKIKNVIFILLLSISIGLSTPFIVNGISSVRDAKWIFYVILLAIAVILMLIEWKNQNIRSWVSPVSLMTISWLPLLFLHNLQLSPVYLVTLTPITWLIILESYIGFSGSSILISKSLIKNRGNLIKEHLIKNTNKSKLQKVIFIFFYIGSAIFIINIVARGGFRNLPIFLGPEAKWAFSLPVIGQLSFLMDVALIWAVLFVSLFGLKSNKKLLVVLLGVIVRDFLLLTRSNIFACAIIGLVIYFLINPRRISIKKIAVFVISLLLLFEVVSVLKIDFNSSDIERSKRDVENGAIQVPNYLLASPYAYLTVSITNLQLNMQYSPPSRGYSRTFAPILSILQIIDVDPRSDYTSYWGGGIIPYQGNFYLDFGFLGMIIGPIVLGIIGGVLYGKIMSNPSILFVIMYSIFSSCIFTSAITNWFCLGRTLYIVLGSFAVYGFMHYRIK